MAKAKKYVKKSGVKKNTPKKPKKQGLARNKVDTVAIPKTEQVDIAAIGQKRADTEDNLGKLLTVEAIAIDFDYVTEGQSPADGIRFLKVKNLPPKKGSKEQKPPGHGFATGQVESRETVLRALTREVEGETGHRVIRVIDWIRTYMKKITEDGQSKINEIFLYLVEVDGHNRGVVERDEIDASVEPWWTFREFFTTPFAQDRFGRNRNPDGVYFSHVAQRLLDTLRYFLIPETIGPFDAEGQQITKIEPTDKLKNWLDTYNRRQLLGQAMQDMKEDGTLARFLNRAYPEGLPPHLEYLEGFMYPTS